MHQAIDQPFGLRVQAPEALVRQRIETIARQELGDLLALMEAPAEPRYVDITFLYDEFWGESGWESDVGGSIFASNHGSGLGISIGMRPRESRQPAMVMSLRYGDQRLWHGIAELGHRDIDPVHPEATAETALRLLAAQLRQDLGQNPIQAPAGPTP